MPSLKVGGGNRVFIEIALRIEKCKLKPSVIYFYNDRNDVNKEYLQRLESAQVNIEPLNLHKNRILSNIWNIDFIKFKRKLENCDIVLVSDPLISILVWLIRPKAKVIRYVQADDYRIFDDLYRLKNKYILKIYKILTRMSFNSSFFHFIFNSQYSYKCFNSHRKEKIDSPNIIYPGIDHSIFKNLNIRSYSKKGVNLILVTRNHPIKGFYIFHSAWQSIKYTSLSKKIKKIYILTPDKDFRWIDKFYTIINPKNDYELNYFYNLSHILIHTSMNEGFGLPPLEAMATGCLTIISKSGGINEYAKNWYNSLLFDVKDIRNLRNLLGFAIKNYKKLYYIRRNAQTTALTFSWDATINKLCNILQE